MKVDKQGMMTGKNKKVWADGRRSESGPFLAMINFNLIIRKTNVTIKEKTIRVWADKNVKNKEGMSHPKKIRFMPVHRDDQF